MTSEETITNMTQNEQEQFNGIDLARVAGSNVAPQPMAMSNYQRTREMSLDELMLENRVIFLIGEINQASAARIMMQMLYLEDQKKGQQVNLYINSPGGVITSGLAIYDTMQLIKSDVSTICVGMAASMGTVLLCAGQAGKRFALPNSTIHMHQAMGGASGQASDIEIAAREILRMQDKIRTILSNHTGQPYEKIARDSDRDYYLAAEDAKEYGLIDDVLGATPDPDGAKAS